MLSISFKLRLFNMNLQLTTNVESLCPALNQGEHGCRVEDGHHYSSFYARFPETPKCQLLCQVLRHEERKEPTSTNFLLNPSLHEGRQEQSLTMWENEMYRLTSADYAELNHGNGVSIVFMGPQRDEH